MDFLLADVFGVSYQGETKERFTYIAPIPGYESLFGDYTRKHPVGFYAPQLMVKAQPGVEILGEMVLTYTDPADSQHFASTHNNPPGRWTGFPAIVINQFGKGLCLYSTIDLECADNARELIASLIRSQVAPFTFETTGFLNSGAPKPVEITAFRQPENHRYIINLVNFQKELPNIPVESIRIRLRMGEQIPERVNVLPGGEPLVFQFQEGIVEFTTPRLETFIMVAIDYRTYSSTQGPK